jgi:hypothetical protein
VLPYGGRLAINPSTLLRTGVQGVKGDELLAEGGDASSKWLRSGFSTKARKCRELESAKRLTGRPKRELVPIGHVVARYVVSTRYEGHGVQCRPFDSAQGRPKVTENGHMERGNPSRLSQVALEQATRPQALTE